MFELNSPASTVLLLTNDRQIDRRILLTADSLDMSGWKTTIVAMPLDAPASEDSRTQRIGSEQTIERREGIVVEGYRLLRRMLGTSRGPVRALKRLAWQFLVNQESFFQRLFWPHIQHLQPDVVVANDLPMLPVAYKLASSCGARLVYDSHELYCEQGFSPREKKTWAHIERKYIQHCDAVITVNASIAEELRTRYALRKVHVIHNAERCSTTQTRTRYFHDRWSLPAESRILLFQGGLSSGRNLEALARSMQYVSTANIVLVILGSGELTTPLQRLISGLKLQQRVFLHPAVPQHELLHLTAAADAGVIPYQANCLNNFYCTPNKLFEFISAGLPILGSDLPEIRKIVTGNGIGLVGDLSEPKGIAKRIDELFSDPVRFREFIDRVADARKVICWEEEEKSLIAIYESLR